MSVRCRVVSTNWFKFRERVEALGSLPKLVVNEVDEYCVAGFSNTDSFAVCVSRVDSIDSRHLFSTGNKAWGGRYGVLAHRAPPRSLRYVGGKKKR